MRRRISLFLCLVILLAMIPVVATATQSRVSNFKKTYQLTGVFGDDMVAVAVAQNKLLKKDLGYTEAWCADFVSDCARLAGVPDFPYHGGCTEMRRLLLAWGGIWHDYNEGYVPQKGDIVFYSDVSFEDDDCDHVGLITKSGFNRDGTINTVEGNTSGVDAQGNKSTSCVQVKTRPLSLEGALYVLGYVTINQGPNCEPDYQRPPTRLLKYRGGTFMEGGDVVWVQMVLFRLGYSLDIDGLYGSDSTAAVKDFQKKQGLDDDGDCGVMTVAKLKEAWNDCKGGKSALTIEALEAAPTVGECISCDVSFGGSYTADISVKSSDDAVCTAKLENVDVEDGTAQLRLEPLAKGAAAIQCTIYDEWGNAIKSRSMQLLIGEKWEHHQSWPVIENIVHATPDSYGDYDQVFYCTDCGEALVRTPVSVPLIAGDLDGDAIITDGDVFYMLKSMEDSENYPIYQTLDYNKDKEVTDADAIYLLNHTLRAERYPLDE